MYNTHTHTRRGERERDRELWLGEVTHKGEGSLFSILEKLPPLASLRLHPYHPKGRENRCVLAITSSSQYTGKVDEGGQRRGAEPQSRSSSV